MAQGPHPQGRVRQDLWLLDDCPLSRKRMLISVPRCRYHSVYNVLTLNSSSALSPTVISMTFCVLALTLPFLSSSVSQTFLSCSIPLSTLNLLLCEFHPPSSFTWRLTPLRPPRFLSSSVCRVSFLSATVRRGCVSLLLLMVTSGLIPLLFLKILISLKGNEGPQSISPWHLPTSGPLSPIQGFGTWCTFSVWAPGPAILRCDFHPHWLYTQHSGLSGPWPLCLHWPSLPHIHHPLFQ